MSDRGSSKCSRKLSLTVFFLLELIAFTFSLLALVSPSWQYVYLENGRTEHHHGLWLDCKRDYSYDYGRTREYYETLYRRDLQGSPFAEFFLPPLQCVYKFDYYIDQEDLYDHNHDENRIQNDAYQHLWLGWKIGALAALCVALVVSASSLLLGICSYCHRTFICASTVLVTIAAIMSVVGLSVFYIWANYQDNKVIKEEEDTHVYEQIFGWAFEFQLIATVLHWISSMIGCCATSISLQKGRAKLVKIEVVDSDESSLLASSSNVTSQPFKRSFSAIYRVDSEALRRWERDYMKNMKNGQPQQSNNFKRTASVPNFSKKQRKAIQKAQREMARSQADLFTSTSNIMSDRTVTTGASNTLESNHDRRPSIPIGSSTPKSCLKKSSIPSLSMNTMGNQSYEYIPCDSSIGLSTFRMERSPNQKTVYDPVYEQIQGDGYLEPNSVKNIRNSSSTISEEITKKALLPIMPNVRDSVQSIPTPKTTVIDDVVVRPGSNQEMNRIRERITKEQQTIEELRRRQLMFREEKRDEDREERQTSQSSTSFEPKSIMKPPSLPSKSTKPPLTIRDIGITTGRRENGYAELEMERGSGMNVASTSTFGVSSAVPTKTTVLGVSIRPTVPHSSVSIRQDPTVPSPSIRDSTNGDSTRPSSAIAINTFGGDGSSRSITNLFRPPLVSSTEIFNRPESISSESSIPINRKTLLNRRFLPSIPDEVDRSVGSSTLLENDCLRSDTPSTYVRDAEIRLNLFLNDTNQSNKDSVTTV